MAQKIEVTLVDDLDGGPAEETVRFSLDGTSYEIDLSEPNATALREALAGYVGAARRGARRGRPARAAAGGARPVGEVDPREVRAWAAANDIPVNPRGRVPRELVERYTAAVQPS